MPLPLWRQDQRNGELSETFILIHRPMLHSFSTILRLICEVKMYQGHLQQPGHSQQFVPHPMNREHMKSIGLPSFMGGSWHAALKNEFDLPYFKTLAQFVYNERATRIPIYPPAQEVFNWTRFCYIEDVKAVIVGQDPYPTPGFANGLAFSVKPPYPPTQSLKNIFKEVSVDMNLPYMKDIGHGDLSYWAQQGVLLINSVLTVRDDSPGSHTGHGWEYFTDAVIRCVAWGSKPVVFMLWGEDAKKKATQITERRHCVLTTSHPSSRSAHLGFNGCKHFSKANKFLRDNGRREIDWRL